MKTFAQIVSWLALAVSFVPSLIYLGGAMTLPAMKTWMLAGTVLWFVTVPLWMGRSDQA